MKPQMTVDGKRNRGRPNMRWRDLVEEEMARNRMSTDMREDGKHWHVMIQVGTLRSVEPGRCAGEKEITTMKASGERTRGRSRL